MGFAGVSCSGSGPGQEGPDNSGNDDLIVGTWKMDSFSWNTTSTTDEVAIEMSAEGKNMDDVRITFHPDGTTSVSGGTFTVVYTMTANGYSTTNEIETKPQIQNGTWKREGDTLIGDYPDNQLGPQKIKIVALDDKTLHLATTTKPPMPVPGMGDISIDVRYSRAD